MAKSAPRLGKGLRALVTGTAESPASQAPAAPQPAAAPGTEQAPPQPVIEYIHQPQEIPLDAVRPNAKQPRTHFDDYAIAELAASIRVHGVIQPVVVRDLGDGAFELIAGERRCRAAREAGLTTVPAIVRQCSDQEALELALIENLQREDLNPIERAMAYRQYLDTMDATVEQLAARLGESRANIANYMRLLSLADEILELLQSNQLGMGQARAIAGIEDHQRQLQVARLAVRRNLSVRQVEQLAKQAPSQPTAQQPPAATDRHLADVQQAFSRALGMSVHVTPGRKKNSGRVTIHYGNLDEFDQIAQRLGVNAELD